MLVLTRKPGERLKIGDAVLLIAEITRTRVRLAIEAPPHVIIAREELGAWDPLRKPRNAMEAAASNARSGGGEDQFTDADLIPATKACDARAGSQAKLDELCRRAENGECLWCDADRDRRLLNAAEIERWVTEDLHADHLTRRRFEFKQREVVTVGDRLVEVDRVGLKGQHLLLRDAETLAWFSVFDVLESPASDVMRRITGLVNGRDDLGKELRDA